MVQEVVIQMVTHITYKWTPPAGIGFEDSDELVNPTFVAPGVGVTAQTFTFSLIVTDSKGLPSEQADTVDVTVSPTPPLAYAGADRIEVFPAGEEIITVNIDDSYGFDLNGAADKSDLDYLWEVVDSETTYSGLILNKYNKRYNKFQCQWGWYCCIKIHCYRC